MKRNVLTQEQILAALGLERKKSARATALETIGAFSAGVLVGAGAALLLTPISGPELRSRIVEAIRSRMPVDRGEEPIGAPAGEARPPL